jgi:tetratricopeptide (TPR) repeat protein
LAENDNLANRERSSRYQATKVAADIALNAGDVGAARQLIADLGEDALVLDAAQESSSFAAEVARAVVSWPPPPAAEPGLPWARAARGITYRLMGRHKDAITDLGAAIDADPGYALALANRGEVRRLDRQYSDALADLEEAVRLLPDYAWAIGSRGQVYQALGRTAEAFADFEHALGLDPHLRWVTAARSAMTGRNSVC